MLSEKNNEDPILGITNQKGRKNVMNMNMSNKYVFDTDYKTLYENAMEKLKKYEQKEKEKIIKKDNKNEDGERYKELYQELVKENNRRIEEHRKDNLENKKIIKELTEIIDKLNNKINKINTSESKNNINKINIEEIKEYQILLKENEQLRLEKDTKNNKETNINIEQKYIDENIKLKKLEEDYKKQIEELKKGIKETKNKTNDTKDANNSNGIIEETRKKRDKRNKGKPILDRFPIHLYNVTDEDSKNDPDIKNLLYFANMEEYIIMNHNSDIVDEVDKINKVSIEFLVDYRLKYEGKNITNNSKMYMTRKILRSKDLFKDYKEKLLKVRFSLSNLSRMSNNDYIEWKNELHKILDNVEEVNNYNVCGYIIKSGKRKGLPCGKYNCMRHKNH